jgi:hypothetical protein
MSLLLHFNKLGYKYLVPFISKIKKKDKNVFSHYYYPFNSLLLHLCFSLIINTKCTPRLIQNDIHIIMYDICVIYF